MVLKIKRKIKLNTKKLPKKVLSSKNHKKPRQVSARTETNCKSQPLFFKRRPVALADRLPTGPDSPATKINL
jgi:hypothetical protein